MAIDAGHVNRCDEKLKNVSHQKFAFSDENTQVIGNCIAKPKK
jgi:hypothetical protein